MSASEQVEFKVEICRVGAPGSKKRIYTRPAMVKAIAECRGQLYGTVVDTYENLSKDDVLVLNLEDITHKVTDIYIEETTGLVMATIKPVAGPTGDNLCNLFQNNLVVFRPRSTAVMEKGANGTIRLVEIKLISIDAIKIENAQPIPPPFQLEEDAVVDIKGLHNCLVDSGIFTDDFEILGKVILRMNKVIHCKSENGVRYWKLSDVMKYIDDFKKQLHDIQKSKTDAAAA